MKTKRTVKSEKEIREWFNKNNWVEDEIYFGDEDKMEHFDKDLFFHCGKEFDTDEGGWLITDTSKKYRTIVYFREEWLEPIFEPSPIAKPDLSGHPLKSKLSEVKEDAEIEAWKFLKESLKISSFSKDLVYVAVKVLKL